MKPSQMLSWLSEVEKDDVRVKIQRSSRSMSNTLRHLSLEDVRSQKLIRKVHQKLISNFAHKIFLAESLLVYNLAHKDHRRSAMLNPLNFWAVKSNNPTVFQPVRLAVILNKNDY
jgi:hypothetical protein